MILSVTNVLNRLEACMPNRSISRVRRNISLLLVALLFVSWGFFALSSSRDYRTIDQQSSRNLQTLALGLEMHTIQIVELIDSLLLETVHHYLHHSTTELEELFRSWLLRFPAFSSLAVIDRNSQEVLFSINNRGEPDVFRYHTAAAFSGNCNDLELAGELFPGVDGRQQIALSRVFQQDGTLLRVVALLPADFFLDFHQEANLGPGGSIAIFHHNGLLLARDPYGKTMAGRSFADSPLFRTVLPRSPIGLTQAPQETDGIMRLVAHRKLECLPLVVTVGASITSIFSDWQQRFVDYLILQLVVSAVIILAWVMQFRILSRVEKVEIDLKERKEHFQAVADSSVDAVISVNTDEQVRFWSAGAEQTFGCSAADAINMPITCFLQFAENDRPLTLKQLADKQSAWAAEKIHEVQGQRKSGELFPTELSLSSGVASGRSFYTLIVRDITERRQMEERAKRLASHDTLTGLPNRSLLTDRLQVAMAQIRRQGGQFALLFVDLDQFKPVNDTFGHDAGDRLLQQVAKRMKVTVRESDTVARLGGDEFALLLLNAENEEAVEQVCQHLLESLRQKFNINGKQVQISCSIGVVLYHGQEKTACELIGLADNAMYAAKRGGKNRFVLVSD